MGNAVLWQTYETRIPEVTQMSILIIGATGFVGENLCKEFIKTDTPFKAMSRNIHKINFNSELVTKIQADLTNPESLVKALEDVNTIYYFAHSLDESHNFSEKEETQAQNLANLLTNKHKVIYLSGITPEEDLSAHLASRSKVGEILASTKAKVLELRASIVIGHGSASFELIRAIVERFPIILDARWARELCQPIGIEQLTSILVQSKDIELDQSRILEVGGDEKLPYYKLLTRTAKILGKRRATLKINDFPKPIVDKAMKIFLPEFYQVSSKLFGSIEHETIVKDIEFKSFFQMPKHNLDDCIAKAIKDGKQHFEQISIEELVRYVQKGNDIKFEGEQVFGLDINIPTSNLEKLLKGIQFVNNKLPFSLYQIDNITHHRDKITTGLKIKRGPKIDVNFVKDGDRCVQLLIVYKAAGFIDALLATNSFVQKFKGLIHGTI